MIANFRMYSPVPAAARAWQALFERVFAGAALDIAIVEHPPAAPLAQLYTREDLACAFMCGWPFIRSGRMQAIAAPVPSPQRYESLPRYRSEFLVREASGWLALEHTLGHRFGWTAADSQSGFNAPRAHLARYMTPDRPSLFSEVVGPLGAPMAALQALIRGDVDAIALDGFWLDILRRHDPSKLDGIRCVGTTPWTPLPLLVAAPQIEPAIVARLRDAIFSAHERPSYGGLLEGVLVERFVAPHMGSYAALESMARSAEDAGYREIR